MIAEADVDGDGQIFFMRVINGFVFTYAQDEIEGMIAEADVDGDGRSDIL
jgi:Ca2+-binding EF-hand superfamily protein